MKQEIKDRMKAYNNQKENKNKNKVLKFPKCIGKFPECKDYKSNGQYIECKKCPYGK